ncbi:MAG: DUF3606 domain-containing protein [Bauldia sp.]|nr:DUF3606 domain-containing protein [Bauldia sp.]
MTIDDNDEVVVEIIDFADADNVRYWCKRWGVTEEDLQAAAEHAGTSEVPAVSFALGREGHR